MGVLNDKICKNKRIINIITNENSTFDFWLFTII